MLLLAWSLAVELAETLIPSIAATPFSWAVATAESVLALAIFCLAVFAAFWACWFKLAFSSSVRVVDLLISACLLARASSIALSAAVLVADSVGTLIPSIAATPFFWAVVTACSVSAAEIISLAVFTAWATWSLMPFFSSSVNEDPSIALFLPAAALSIAAFATVLSMVTLPAVAAEVTASLVVALLIASFAALASLSTCALAAFLSSSVKLVSWSIAFLEASTALVKSAVAFPLASLTLVVALVVKALCASVIALAALSTSAWVNGDGAVVGSNNCWPAFTASSYCFWSSALASL